MTQTKKISGVDCQRRSFAYAPTDDPASWMLPVWIPGDAAKTVNLVKNALYRFDAAKLPYGDRQRVFDTLRGAAMAHGLEIQQRAFQQTAEAASPAKVVVQRRIEKDSSIEDVVAEADRRASAMLRSLGLD